MFQWWVNLKEQYCASSFSSSKSTEKLEKNWLNTALSYQNIDESWKLKKELQIEKEMKKIDEDRKMKEKKKKKKKNRSN